MGRGTLVFKGESAKRKKKKSKHKADRTDEKEKHYSDASVMPSRPAVADSPEKKATPELKNGVGAITTSGTVVTGHGTRFMKEIRVGDALIVEVDNQPEMRVVTMRLSDISLNLSSAFSQNMATAVSFRYIPKPRDVAKEAAHAQQKAAQAVAEEERHASASAETGELVYRERTEHGNYRTRRVKVDGERNRSDLLQLRSKKTSDKYC